MYLLTSILIVRSCFIILHTACFASKFPSKHSSQGGKRSTLACRIHIVGCYQASKTCWYVADGAARLVIVVGILGRHSCPTLPQSPVALSSFAFISACFPLRNVTHSGLSSFKSLLSFVLVWWCVNMSIQKKKEKEKMFMALEKSVLILNSYLILDLVIHINCPSSIYTVWTVFEGLTTEVCQIHQLIFNVNKWIYLFSSTGKILVHWDPNYFTATMNPKDFFSKTIHFKHSTVY